MYHQGTHCTGKTGKIAKNSQGKHREFGNFATTQGICFAQLVNSLILKVTNIAIFAAKNSPTNFEAGYVFQVSVVYVKVTNHVNWHRENLQSDGKNREFENEIRVGTLIIFDDFIVFGQSHLLQMSLANMNTQKFSPRKDYNANRLTSGLLQLSERTHLVIDETALQPGQLDANGK